MDESVKKYFSKLGKKGGATNKKKGKKYFSDMGKKGAEKRWANLKNKQSETSNN